MDEIRKEQEKIAEAHVGYRVEKVFTVGDIVCVIVGTSIGHRCGYIGVDRGHPLHGMHFDDLRQEGISVHGDWTYEGSSERGYPIRLERDVWWIGFDCGHCNDGRDLGLIRDLNSPSVSAHLEAMEQRYPTCNEVRSVGYLELEIRKAVQLINSREW